jgi:succinate dehydrogenase / fumarate reductase flavoprotein subunit
MFAAREMLDLVVVNGIARGIVVRDLVTREDRVARGRRRWCSRPAGYGTSSILSTNAKGCNVTATWRAHKKGALFANPCYTQIHPTCIPVSGDHQSKLTLMSESLRNDGRIWVPKTKGDARSPTRSRSRSRLLPRAALPELRQPRAARHQLARGEAGL